MSPTVQHVVTLTAYKPKKSGNDLTAVSKALKQVESAPGCKGWRFEGVAKEDPSVSVRCIERDSDKSASSPAANDFDASIKDISPETLYSRTYNIFDPLDETLSPQPKCLEYVVFSLKSGIDFAADFYPKWRQALKAVEASPGCCPVSLGQCADEPERIVQIQGWMTLEDHLEGFKKRDDLDSIMGPLTEVVNEYVADGWKGFNAYHLLVRGPGEA